MENTIKQSYKLFDVTGIIDKNARIYFVPHANEMRDYNGENISFAYLELLEQDAVNFSPDFIDISSWNPEDRTLTVEGKIDNFRKGSSNHVANYIIIHREEIDDEEVTIKDYYSGFFITDAKQAGLNSVRLTLEPDEFTNVFFLHNQNIVTENYANDQFNELMRNCFVQRQHYNRVKSDYLISLKPIESTVFVANKSYAINKMIHTFYSYTIAWDSDENDRIKVSILKNGKLTQAFNCTTIEYEGGNIFNKFEFLDSSNNVIYVLQMSDYNNDSDYIVFEILSENYTSTCPINFISELQNDYYLYPVNMELFAKTKEVFDFKQMIKTSRKLVNVLKAQTGGTIVTKLPDSLHLSSIGSESAVKEYIRTHREDARIVASACVKYLHILTKDRITYPTTTKIHYAEDATTYIGANYSSDYEHGKTIPSAQQHLVVPFVDNLFGQMQLFCNYFQKMGIEMFAFANPNTSVGTSLGVISSGDIANLIMRLQEVLGYYIESIYVTPYSECSKSMDIVDANVDDYRIRFSTSLYNTGINETAEYKDDLEWAGIKPRAQLPLELDKYDSRVVPTPTFAFIPNVRPETEFNRSNTGNNVLDTLLYQYKSLFRKNIVINDEKYVNRPVELFESNGAVTPEVVLYDLVKANVYSELVLCPAIIVGEKGFSDYKYQINEYVNPLSFKTSYYEPILEFEPYKMTTFSFLDSETAIQRRRLVYSFDYTIQQSGSYKLNYFVALKYNQTVTGQYKFGLIPSYYYDDEKMDFERYYTDALIYVSSNGMTIRNNTYYEYAYTQSARMSSESFLQSLNPVLDLIQYSLVDAPANVSKGLLGGGAKGGMSASIDVVQDEANMIIDYFQNNNTLRIRQEAQLSGAGAKADSYKNVGTELYYELNNDEYIIYENTYQIDSLSYDSISKMLERYGYRVDIYDKLNVDDRRGWNYIKLVSFDFFEHYLSLSDRQSEVIKDLFTRGITLLHEPTLLYESKKNYEIDIDNIED